VDKAAKAKNKMSVALVTSRPVGAMPSVTPTVVEPVRSRGHGHRDPRCAMSRSRCHGWAASDGQARPDTAEPHS
jgi:hypothetical protein